MNFYIPTSWSGSLLSLSFNFSIQTFRFFSPEVKSSRIWIFMSQCWHHYFQSANSKPFPWHIPRIIRNYSKIVQKKRIIHPETESPEKMFLHLISLLMSKLQITSVKMILFLANIWNEGWRMSWKFAFIVMEIFYIRINQFFLPLKDGLIFRESNLNSLYGKLHINGTFYFFVKIKTFWLWYWNFDLVIVNMTIL